MKMATYTGGCASLTSITMADAGSHRGPGAVSAEEIDAASQLVFKVRHKMPFPQEASDDALLTEVADVDC